MAKQVILAVLLSLGAGATAAFAQLPPELVHLEPLAGDEAAFRRLLTAREPLYRAVATRVVPVAGREPGTIAAGLAAALTGAAAEGAPTDDATAVAAARPEGGAR